MKHINRREENRYAAQSQSTSNDHENPLEAYGSNFGEGARPYGEDYGDDTDHGQGELDLENNNRHGLGQRNQYDKERRRIGFRYSHAETRFPESFETRNEPYDFPRTGRYHDPWFDEQAERGHRREDHRGKGPKDHRRSDERIREDLHQRLTDDEWVDARDIEVEVKDCEVVLNGTVRDRSSKRRAADIAESVSGVTQVENRIRVK